MTKTFLPLIRCLEVILSVLKFEFRLFEFISRVAFDVFRSEKHFLDPGFPVISCTWRIYLLRLNNSAIII